MAHFAELDANGIVLQVIVVGNEMILDANGNESEELGIAYCRSLFGQNTQWIQTSYNGNFRKNFAGVRATYDANRDAFLPPKPEGDQWVLDENTCQWLDKETIGINTDIGVSRV
jgi:hypothetical protein